MPNANGADSTKQWQALTAQRLQSLSFLQVTYVSLVSNLQKIMYAKPALQLKGFTVSMGFKTWRAVPKKTIQLRSES